MKPPNAFAAKGEVVEEWIDVHFFRPLGFRIARRLLPTRVSADQVTAASLVIGLVAGHLFVYNSARLNALGVLLFIVSDIFDSADGQLARSRGTSTRFGRILDGVSDNVRFINLYVHLIVRLALAGWGWPGLLLGLVAGVSHSFQSSAVDFIRQAYLQIGAGEGSELELPETLSRRPPGTGPWQRLGAALYASYVRRQAWLLSRTANLVRAVGPTPPDTFRLEYRERMAGIVVQCAWVAQNVRFLLLAMTATRGWPMGFFWITIVPMNLVLLALITVQEARAASLLHALEPAQSHAGA